jgi:hypothetical protein
MFALALSPFRLNMTKPVGEILAYTRHDYGYPLA